MYGFRFSFSVFGLGLGLGVLPSGPIGFRGLGFRVSALGIIVQGLLLRN